MTTTSFTHAGLEFQVTEAGPADGTPVVLLHGFPQRSTCWAGVTERLNAEGLRTYALDQRGYSPGARPFGRWAYRVPILIEDAIAFIEHVGGPVHLAAHDWGSTVAWGVVARRPDLVASLTALSIPHGGALKRAWTSSNQVKQSSYMGLFALPLVMEALTAVRPQVLDSMLRASGMTDEQLERFHREIVDDGALPYALGWYRGLPLVSVPKLVPGLRSTPLAARIAGETGEGRSWTGRSRVPTTYIWSTLDSTVTRTAAEACGDFVAADYRYVELAGASHWIPEEAPDVVAQAVLDRVRGDA